MTSLRRAARPALGRWAPGVEEPLGPADTWNDWARSPGSGKDERSASARRSGALPGGLPNGILLHERLADLLAGKDQPAGNDQPAGKDQLAVLFIDLDGFRGINDTLGRGAGDELLTRAAERLGAIVRPLDTLARTGGDEFVVLLPGTGPEAGTDVAQRIVDDFRRPFVLDGRVSRSVTVSVGVAAVPAGTEVGEALRQADLALHHAKRSGRDRLAIFEPA